MKNNLIVLVFICLSIVSCEKEDEEKRFGGLEGDVKNKFGQGIGNALVKAGLSTVKTNESGRYRFTKLEVDDYDITVIGETFLPETKQVQIMEDEVNQLNFILQTGEPTLSISESICNVRPVKGVQYINVESNASWLIEEKCQWIECDQSKGEGNGKIRVSWNENNGDLERQDTIWFRAGDLTRTLVVLQTNKLKILEIKGIIGNNAVDIRDSVYVKFNKAITIEKIKSNYDLCYSDMNYELLENSTALEFSYACAKLGKSYPFSIRVKDDKGQVASFEIDVPFFKHKLEYEGYITGYALLNDEKEAVISSFNPPRVTHYSLESGEVLNTFDLSNYFSPTDISYNPYNSLVYLVGAETDAVFRHTSTKYPHVHTLNLTTGKIEKVITLEPDENDHPDYPHTIPSVPQFTETGIGIITMKDKAGNFGGWKVVDCTGDTHELYRVEKSNQEINGGEAISKMYLNHDKTKLIIMQHYGSCQYLIFDGITQSVEIVTSPEITRSGFLAPNKRNSKVYVGQLYAQFIMELDKSFVSPMSYMGGGSLEGAGFSYKEGEENIIYSLSENYLKLMDYNKSETPMWCDIEYDLDGFTSTVDGRHLIGYKKYNYKSSFFVFDTNLFYKHLSTTKNKNVKLDSNDW